MIPSQKCTLKVMLFGYPVSCIISPMNTILWNGTLELQDNNNNK